MLYGLQDVTLVPAVTSEVNSRMECNPYYGNKLPLFTAPMSQIVNEGNWEVFDNHGINAIIPRNVNLERRLELCIKTFCAFSLDEFEEYFIHSVPEDSDQLFKDARYVLVDVANGHMERLINACAMAKRIWNNSLVLMAGNVANPETYEVYAKAGIDYIRLSIGSGSQCTTANTGIYYPMASLIANTNTRRTVLRHSKTFIKTLPKIVADGGFNTYGDIIKALALGADYVMCGKIFAKAVEACGEIYWGSYPSGFDVMACGPFNEWIRHQSIDDIKFWNCCREYYGMSTKRAQKEFGKEGNKTEEGIVSTISVDYYLVDWVKTFTDYLRSAMSYTGHTNIAIFVGNVRFEILSPTTIRTFK